MDAPSCHPDRPSFCKGVCRQCYNSAYSKSHREQINANKRRRYEEDPTLKRKDDSNYYAKHCERVKERYRNDRLLAIAHLGGKCQVCGFDDIRALHIDHVNSDGAEDRRNGGNQAVYRRVLKDTTGKYQLLCANHNAIKMYERDEFAHSKLRVA